MHPWIFDIATRKGTIELWAKEEGRTVCISEPFSHTFLAAFDDPSRHDMLIGELMDRHGAEPCRFRTVYGMHDGYRIHGGLAVAEALEQQAGYGLQLYNADVRTEQLYFAGNGMVPCSPGGGTPFSTDRDHPLSVLRVQPAGRPGRGGRLDAVTVTGSRRREIHGRSETQVVGDLFSVIGDEDPDLLLFHGVDGWAERLLRASDKSGVPLALSRTGRYRTLGEKSYISYGQMMHRPAAVIPEGRVLIDTDASFIYRQGGLEGVFLASRLTGLSPNLTSRFSPGTIVSRYEIARALAQGIAVPFRKADAEAPRCCKDVRLDYRGGTILQPAPGIHAGVTQIDFTSFYPSIIVRYNISPETLAHPERAGFLPSVIEPLLHFRYRTKQLKKAEPAYAGMDAILKWMLVTCFGYTGYKNAKFGRIEMHEKITSISSEILTSVMDMAEAMGYPVLHGIVDCLWVWGEDATDLKAAIEEATQIPTEAEVYDWLVFLPQNDGSGSYSNYYGKLTGGGMKTRGVMARRKDTPPYIREMQEACFAVMEHARTPVALAACNNDVVAVYRQYREGLLHASPEAFVIRRRLSKIRYEKSCLSAGAVSAYRNAGISLSPGMEVEYVVRDAARHAVDPAWKAGPPDYAYYEQLLRKAWSEIDFAFSCLKQGKEEMGINQRGGGTRPRSNQDRCTTTEELSRFSGPGH